MPLNYSTRNSVPNKSLHILMNFRRIYHYIILSYIFYYATLSVFLIISLCRFFYKCFHSDNTKVNYEKQKVVIVRIYLVSQKMNHGYFDHIECPSSKCIQMNHGYFDCIEY